MLPSWMEKSLPKSGPTVLPTKANLLRSALIGANPQITDTRDRSRKIYNSISDAAMEFSSSANSLIGSIFDVLPGKPIQYFRENRALTEANKSDARKEEEQLESQEMASAKERGTLSQVGTRLKQLASSPLQTAAKIAGNAAPFVATMGIGLPAEATAYTIGAVAGGGAIKGGIYDTVMGSSDSQLMSDKDYATLRALGSSEQSAKERLAEKLSSYGENGGRIALGALLGVATARLGADVQLGRVLSGEVRSGIAREELANIAGRGLLKGAALSAGKEGLSEGVQEATEQYLQNTGAGSGGANIDPTEGMVQSFVDAAVTSSPLGAYAGATEVAQAGRRIDQNKAGDVIRNQIDSRNKANLSNKNSNPIESVIAEEVPIKEIPDIQISKNKSIADGPEAAVYNGYIDKGLSPYNSLVEAGFEINTPEKVREVRKLANKVAEKVMPIAKEVKKQISANEPNVQAAIQEVNSPLHEAMKPEPVIKDVIPTDIQRELDQQNEQSVVEEVKPLEPEVINSIKSSELNTEEIQRQSIESRKQNAIGNATDAQFEVSGEPINVPYKYGERNKSIIWSPENNPITSEGNQTESAPSEVSLDLSSAPKLELVDENPLEALAPNSLQGKVVEQIKQSSNPNAAKSDRELTEEEQIALEQPDDWDTIFDDIEDPRFANIPIRKPNGDVVYNYNYGGEDIEVTPEQKMNLDLLDESVREDHDPAQAKRIGAMKRLVLNRLTKEDRAYMVAKEAKNYKGKRVTVDGVEGRVVATPGGKVTVEFNNGTRSTVAKNKVVSIASDMENLANIKGKTSETVPTHEYSGGMSESLSQNTYDNYGNVKKDQREKNEADQENNNHPIRGTNMIVYNPDLDMADNVIKGLQQMGELARRSRIAMMKFALQADIHTASFAGLSGSGRFFGVNRTSSPGGRVYINPIIIARFHKFDTKLTAKEIVEAIIHELAHEVKDSSPNAHSAEVFGKELARIYSKIDPQTISEMENYIAKSLNMSSLKAMAEEQSSIWNEKFNQGYKIAKEIENASRRESSSLKNSVANESSGRGSPNKSGKDQIRNSSTQQSGTEGGETVSGRSIKETKRMAPRSDSRGGDGEAGTIGNPPDGLEESLFKLPEWTKLNSLEETWLNKYNRIDQITKHLGDKARAITPEAAERISELNYRYVRPLEKLLGKNNRSLDELDKFSRAMQAVRGRTVDGVEVGRNETIRQRTGINDGASMSDEEAEKIIKKYKDDKVIKRAHEIVMSIAEAQRNELVTSGLVSEEEMSQAQKAMGIFYVPLHSAEVNSGYGNFAAGLQVRGRDLNRAEGITGPVKNVIAALIEQTNRTYVRGRRNAFMIDFADFVKNNPSDVWEMADFNVEKDKYVEYRNKGSISRIKINDEYLKKQIEGMKPDELRSFISSMRSFSRLYSMLSTKFNPIFPFTNFLRDTPMGLARVFSNDGAAAAKSTWDNLAPSLQASYIFRGKRELADDVVVRKMMAARKSGDTRTENKMRLILRAKQLLLSGGVPSWQGMSDAADIKTDIEGGVIAASGNKTAKSVAMKASRNFFDFVGRANETIETGIRLSYFDHLMSLEEQKLNDKYIEENGENPPENLLVDPKKVLEISSKVRSLTGDFQAQGVAARYMGAFYPFFNASVQGMRSIGQMAVDAGNGNRRAQYVFATLAAIGMMEDAINSALSGDDDDDGISNYDSIPDWLKRQKYIIPLADGKSAVIPMTYGLSMAVNTGKLLGRMARGRATSGDFAREMALSTWESSNPLGSAPTLTQMISPVQVDPIVQIAENKDWRGNRLFPDRYPGQEWKPNSEIAAKKDTQLSRSIAKMINEFTGGSDTEKGALANTPIGDITPYPGAIDATARWAVGGVGRFALQLGSFVMDAAKGEDIDRLPFSSTFFTSPDAFFYKGRFYDQLNQIKQIKSMSNGISANARREELLKKFPEKKHVIEAMTSGDLKKTLPNIAYNDELKKEFARIGIKKIALYKKYDAAVKEIKRLEDNQVPGREDRILEIVNSLNKKYVEASN